MTRAAVAREYVCKRRVATISNLFLFVINRTPDMIQQLYELHRKFLSESKNAEVATFLTVHESIMSVLRRYVPACPPAAGIVREKFRANNLSYTQRAGNSWQKNSLVNCQA